MTPVSLPTISSLLWAPAFGALKMPILDQSSQYKSFWEQNMSWHERDPLTDDGRDQRFDYIYFPWRSYMRWKKTLYRYLASLWRQLWRMDVAALPLERSVGLQRSPPSRCGRCRLRSSKASCHQLWSRWASGRLLTQCRTRWSRPCSCGKHRLLCRPSRSKTSDYRTFGERNC